jgi:putative oxidoreductase
MNVTLWIIQSVLALFFISVGSIKIFSTTEKLKETFAAPVFFTRSLGVLEILGAVGVVLPVLLNIYPQLTAIAAASFGTLMLGAAVFHVQRREYKVLPLISTLFFLSIVVAITRY